MHQEQQPVDGAASAVHSIGAEERGGSDGSCSTESTGAQSPAGSEPGGRTEQPQGPDMGQPHFAGQIPGAVPYGGAPVSGAPQFSGVYYGPAPQYYAHPNMFPQGMPYPGPQPMAQAPAGGYAGQPLPGFDPGGSAAHPVQAPSAPHPQPGEAHANLPPKGEENKYGQLYGLIQDAANGNADVSKFLGFFQSTSSDFWKGALVGTGLTLLLTNDTVKSALGKGVASVWGLFGKSAEDKEAEEDRKAEAKAAKEA